MAKKPIAEWSDAKLATTIRTKRRRYTFIGSGAGRRKLYAELLVLEAELEQRTK